MSSPNNSTCLIDLSGSSESPTSITTPLMSFPPISADEMIVPLIVPLNRFSLSNDPFDSIEKQAKLFGDPFEIVNISSPREPVNAAVPTATLVDVNGSGNSILLSPESQNNSFDPLNKAMCTTGSIAENSSLVNSSNNTMNQAFVKSLSPMHPSNCPNRNRIASDPVTSKVSKTKRKIGSGKARCASLEQLCLKNQMRKSLTNSPAGSPNWSTKSHPANSSDNSLMQKISNSVDFNLTSESIFDDLLSTNPEWIESDNDESDYERMTIPFLKNIQNNESTIASSDCSSDRNSAIEKLSKFRKPTEYVADVGENADASEDKSEGPMNDSPQVDNITSIIETLRNAVEHCGDEKKKSEAAALLDNLNVCLKTASSETSTENSTPETQPLARQRTFSVEGRQRTFSMENRLDEDANTTSPNEVPKELSSSMPAASAQIRKSIGGTTSTTPRRFSRSLSYAGRPVSVVAAVQIQSDSGERRRSSVCTTPTKLVRQTSTNNPKPRGTRTSLGRQSLSSSQDEKAVVKPVQRKIIMKTSNPVPASGVTKPLKVRVGEQTKPIGPLKAIVPYQRSTIAKNGESSILPKTALTLPKTTVKTSTPLAPNNSSKTNMPAASSTPVLNTGRAVPLSHSRLSYTPSTPNVSSLIRQPSSERKKRSVTFSEESDKLSQSMIIGTKETSFQPVS